MRGDRRGELLSLDEVDPGDLASGDFGDLVLSRGDFATAAMEGRDGISSPMLEQVLASSDRGDSLLSCGEKSTQLEKLSNDPAVYLMFTKTKSFEHFQSFLYHIPVFTGVANFF